jgi:hypothetical protein
MTYLDCILRFFNQEDYSHREDVAIIISDIFEQNPNIDLNDFKKKISGIKRDFFRINSLNRGIFAEKIFGILTNEKTYVNEKQSKFDEARDFISKNFEIAYKQLESKEFRAQFIEQFSSLRKPHEKIMVAVNQLLTKMDASFSIDVHGVKEYSGIDIAKHIKSAVIGIQIKTRSDDISENIILSEVTRAQDYDINGFILIYARRNTRKVESSIGGAFHIFKRLNDSKKIYCAIVKPELFAELFRIYKIELER